MRLIDAGRTAPIVAVLGAATCLLAACGGSSNHRATSTGAANGGQVALRTDGLSLGAAVTVATGKMQGAVTATDPASGRLYVAFARDTGKTQPSGFGNWGDPYVTWSDDAGKTFAKPVRLGTNLAHVQSPLVIAVTKKGTVLVEWADNVAAKGTEFGAFNLWIARSTDHGASWTARSALPDGGIQEVSRPNMFLAADGKVWLTWLDGRPVDRKSTDPVYDVRLSVSRNDGRTFSVSYVAKGNACQCCRPALAQAADGTMAMVWRDVTQKPGTEGHGMEMDGMTPTGKDDPGRVYAKTDIRDIKVATSPDEGHDWSLGVEPHKDDWHIQACPTIGPTIGYGPGGPGHQRLSVAWFTGAQLRTGVWVSSSADNGTRWSAPVRLTKDVVGESNDLAQLVAADGSQWVGWATPKTVQIARVSGGEASEAPAQPGTSPTLAIVKGHPLLTYVTNSGVVVRDVTA